MAKINRDKCIGCGACAATCPEGIEMEDGKAKIVHEEVPCIEDAANVCPVGAIEA